MDLRFQRKLRPIAALTLFFFTWISIEPWNYAAWAQAAQKKGDRPVAPASTKTTSGKFEESLRAAKKVVEELDQDVASGKDITLILETLKGHKQTLEAADPEIRAEFAATEKFLKEKKLPQVILDRQAKAVADYDTNYKTLKANIDSVIVLESERKQAEAKGDRAQADRKRDELKDRLKAAKDHLTAKVKEPRHQKLDPNNLPHRAAKPTNKKPRLKKEEFKDMVGANGRSPILLAYNGDPSGLLVAQNTQDLPTDADLAETIEVQFTPEIQGASSLFENDPVTLYEFVRNNFTFEPYYSSVKGSQGTLISQGGNDFDQASLLIALLRYSGIPARYAYGTIEVPISKAMNWLGGVTKSEVALQILGSNGIPATLLYEGAVPKTLQFEHVWVEAYLSYVDYRGEGNNTNAPKTWIPLDPSFKFRDLNPSPIDLAAMQQFDIDQFFNSYITSVRTATPAQDYLQSTIDYVTANMSGQRFDKFLTSGPIIEKVLNLLPGTLPYPVRVIGGRFSILPENYRHQVTLELVDSSTQTVFTYTAAWATLLFSRFTLFYEPATPTDEQTVSAYGGLYTTPPYLVRVKPVLRVEGQVVAEGVAVDMASDLTLKMSFVGPQGIIDDVVSNNILSGAIFAIALDAGQTTGFAVRSRTTKLDAAATAFRSGDPVLGEYFNLLALTYLEQLDSSRALIARTMKLLDTNHIAELMVGQDLMVSYLFDTPRSIASVGLLIDIDRNISTTFHMEGDHSKGRQFHMLSGMMSSYLEHAIFEDTIGVEAVSAIKALQVANTQGIALHQVNLSNLQTQLGVLLLSEDVKNDIRNAVNAGLVVTVSERNVQLNNWNGVGYIILDPITGEGEYRISGGLSGGSLTQVASAWDYLIKACYRQADGTCEFTKEKAKEEIIKLGKKLWFNPPAICSRMRGVMEGHNGLDLGCENWTDVSAAAAGKVTQADWNNPSPGKRSYGLWVEIDHGGGVRTRYGHLCEVKVVVDQDVSEGQTIGFSGNTGDVKTKDPRTGGSVPLPPGTPICSNDSGFQRGAHLHFEMLLNDTEPVDPEVFCIRGFNKC